jgi:adenylate cyclase
MEWKLTAVLCADVSGYSRLMEENEEATLRTLQSHRSLIDTFIDRHRGRFVSSAGDSVLAEFPSVVNAVECAVEVQTALNALNANPPARQKMEFRIGVNLGDVMLDGAQIYGDGINVAARLQNLAEPGGICISEKVRDEVLNNSRPESKRPRFCRRIPLSLWKISSIDSMSRGSDCMKVG